MLPEPKSYKENKFLNSMDTLTFFLGTTRNDNHSWVWDSDGSRVTWTIWDPVKRSHDCAYMKRNTEENTSDKMRWSSVECSVNNVPRTTVCEID